MRPCLFDRCGSVVVSTSAWHAAGRDSIPARTRHVILGVKTWLSTLETVSLCLSEETLKAVLLFYLVSMPGEVKGPIQHVKCVTFRGLHILT